MRSYQFLRSFVISSDGWRVLLMEEFGQVSIRATGMGREAEIRTYVCTLPFASSSVIVSSCAISISKLGRDT